jgi:hypothetical protein
MMWLVIAPPLVAVLGGMLTLGLILTHPDADVRTPHLVPVVAVAQPHGSNSVVPPVD